LQLHHRVQVHCKRSFSRRLQHHSLPPKAVPKMSANDSFPQKGLVVPAEDEKDDNMLGMVFYSFSIYFLASAA
jgi:hypothetical protein